MYALLLSNPKSKLLENCYNHRRRRKKNKFTLVNNDNFIYVWTYLKKCGVSPAPEGYPVILWRHPVLNSNVRVNLCQPWVHLGNLFILEAFRFQPVFLELFSNLCGILVELSLIHQFKSLHVDGLLEVSLGQLSLGLPIRASNTLQLWG